MIELWSWQQEAVDELRANMAAGVQNQVLASPTGSGKTVMAAYIMKAASEKKTRCMFVCDRIALIEQTSKVFDHYDIPHGIIQASHWRWRPWLPVQIASAQTLARRDWPEDIGMIVVDECHTVYKSLAERVKRRECFTIGLSATPLTRGLGKIYDEIVTVRTHQQLQDDGYLCPWTAYSTGEPDMEGAKETAGEWTDDAAEERTMPIVGDAVTEYLRHANGQKFIAFGVTVKHCEALARGFADAGVQVGLYTYRTPDVERSDLIEEFAKPNSRLKGLVSVAALSKGFDAPNVSCIIMCRPLKSSLIEHIQVLGRGLRRDPSNPDKVCTVLDHAGNMVRHWENMTEFFENGIQELDKGKIRKKGESKSSEPVAKRCPECAHIHQAKPSCPNCGHEYPKPAPPPHVPGELTKLTGKKVKKVAEQPGIPGIADDHETKQAVYSQLLQIADERGYKEGWASYNYKEIFGVWPNRSLGKHRGRPSPWLRQWVAEKLRRYAIRQAREGS